MTPRRMVKSSTEPGSHPECEPAFVVVGKLRRAHGLRGEMVMEILTDFPERLTPKKTVFLGEDHQPIRLRTVRDHNKYLLVSFEDHFDPEAVAPFRNALVSVRTDSLPALPEGRYYHHQLIGMQVLDSQGSQLGKLVEILETGSNDVYVIRGDAGGETLLPALEGVVLVVDLEKKEMRVQPPEWE